MKKFNNPYIFHYFILVRLTEMAKKLMKASLVFFLPMKQEIAKINGEKVFQCTNEKIKWSCWVLLFDIFSI